ncbi:hypothetical protein Trydic_g1364 [Trypoxylus dichotomus]
MASHLSARQTAPMLTLTTAWCPSGGVTGVLDPQGPGWIPQPHSHYGAAAGPSHWCERPGRSSDPVTPVGGPYRQVESPFHASCPVHSPFRFRYINGGPEYYHHSHQVCSS